MNQRLAKTMRVKIAHDTRALFAILAHRSTDMICGASTTAGHHTNAPGRFI